MSQVSQIIDEALQLTRRESDSNMRPRLVSALDRAIRHWALRRPWNALKRWENFTADGTRYLVLPRRVRQVLSVSDVDNKIPVRGGTDWHLNAGITWLNGNTDSTPWEFRQLGHVPVISNPETISALTIEASVSEAMSIVVAGLALDTTASGTALELYDATETYVVTGTGSSDTQTLWHSINSIEKSVLDGSARVTIYNASTGQAIAKINPDERGPEYVRLEWLHLPPAGRSLRIEYYTEPERVVNENSTLPTAINREYLTWRLVGDVHWMDNEPEQAAVAYRKADGLMQEDFVAETTQGDHLKRISPRTSVYRRLEGPDLC